MDTIKNHITHPTTLSYSFLKRKGMEYVQQLAGKIWTDYNEHDPGVTTLEELCYALIDLEYRTNFPVEDLLASSPDEQEEEVIQHFFHAEEIFPCNPLTRDDFLKLVLDVDGVRNARILLHDGSKCIQGGYRILLDVEQEATEEKQRDKIIRNVKSTLYRHRNLCEDFFQVELLRRVEISVQAKISIKTESSTEEVERLCATILFNVQSFVAPPVQFYSLRDMLFDKKKTIEEIFTGPLLRNGFIDEQSLQKSSLRSSVYVSEILERISELEQVSSVVEFVVESAGGEKGEIMVESPRDGVLVVNLPKSNIRVESNGTFVDINPAKVQRYFDGMVREQAFTRPYLAKENIAIRQGTFKALDHYYSIQHDFPLIYGVGEEGVVDSASDARKAGVNQLKAYMLFFDQV